MPCIHTNKCRILKTPCDGCDGFEPEIIGARRKHSVIVSGKDVPNDFLLENCRYCGKPVTTDGRFCSKTCEYSFRYNVRKFSKVKNIRKKLQVLTVDAILT